ncbi:MAG: hypothetical protein MUC96_26310 [Myxococcaceae bacterium]|jgi:hypothetical protein|nr:hypothetical protein [Myxococcaceae bacterium]
MILSCALALVVSQTSPPLAPAPDAATMLVPSTEVMRPPPNEPPEVAAFASFLDKHLLTFDVDQTTGLKVRQRERLFSLRDDDFADAFRLVPEAFNSAQKAHDAFRLANIFQIVGLSISGLSLAVVVVAPLLISGSAFLPLLAAGLVGSLVALVLVLIAVPFTITANTAFMSAVATYNKGLLELRPMPQGGAGAVPQGLQIPLP